MNKSIKDIFLKLLIVTLLFFNSCEKDKKTGLPVDGDGNVYDTVRIGTQTWLKENLKTTKYNNGDPIPHITDNAEWMTFGRGAYCWYDNNPGYKDTYGALYNGHAARLANFICPVGYHVPDDTEWRTLIDYLGGEEIAGDKLKAAGAQFWGVNNQSTNESGFTAIPGGWRHNYDGIFGSIGSYGKYWSSTFGHYVDMHSSNSWAYIKGLSPQTGFSVRCIKDD